MSDDKCTDFPAHVRRAKSIEATVCDHGTLTFHLKDADNSTFAVVILPVENAVTFMNGVIRELSEFIEYEPAPELTPVLHS